LQRGSGRSIGRCKERSGRDRHATRIGRAARELIETLEQRLRKKLTLEPITLRRKVHIIIAG
jgi:hypothetical protein